MVVVRECVCPEPANGAWGQLQADGDWFDNNWDYRKPCVINAASGAGTGYQVRVNVHYLNGTDSGADVFLGGKCKGGFGDVRFTAVDGTSLLSCWMESPVSDNATFWVKITANLTASATIIYIYYGNSAANSTSNGTATFDFFDDFSTNTGWTLDGSTINCGTLNLNKSNAYSAEKNRTSGYDDYRFRFRAATNATNGLWEACPRGRGYYPNCNPRLAVGNYSYDPFCVRFYGQDGNSLLLYASADENGHLIQVLKSGSNFAVTWDSLSSSYSNSAQETGDKIAFCANMLNGPLQVDWVFLAKYVSSEPAFGGWAQRRELGRQRLRLQHL